MADNLDSYTIAKLGGVFIIALLAINALEYLWDAITRGELIGDELALLAAVFLFALFAGLVLQQRR